jgi:hypothetical protein
MRSAFFGRRSTSFLRDTGRSDKSATASGANLQMITT